MIENQNYLGQLYFNKGKRIGQHGKKAERNEIKRSGCSVVRIFIKAPWRKAMLRTSIKANYLSYQIILLLTNLKKGIQKVGSFCPAQLQKGFLESSGKNMASKEEWRDQNVALHIHALRMQALGVLVNQKSNIRLRLHSKIHHLLNPFKDNRKSKCLSTMRWIPNAYKW